ncbi:exo-alpha-sialidase [Sphingobacterium olei]|uniref:exo-alpha-sialidase n=1 Tax=Sphingobacterium olei TaxID=2571155 RepID=A0A4U0NYG9_9SPHI|nr:sialidase family protein [Sphingobacterium olei]TJZ59911.1 exo-alpha-sialidase [Sphingobacterium olei]
MRILFLTLLWFQLATADTYGVSSNDNIVEIQRAVPVLIGKETVVSRIKVSGLQGKILEGISVVWNDSKLTSPAMELRIYAAGNDSLYANDVKAEWKLFGRATSKIEAKKIAGNYAIAHPETYLYVTCLLAEPHRVGETFTFTVKRAQVDRKAQAVKQLNPVKYNTGIALREHMQDDIHTSRIPGLARSNKGTLLAIFDARYESARDLQGHMDIGLHRSEDSGETWQPIQIAMDMGEWGGLPQKFNGVSDACILVDAGSDAIYIAATWMHGVLDDKGQWISNLTDTSTVWNHQWRQRGSQPGYDIKTSSQFLIVKSTDDGKTWGQPVNITAMGKQKDWWLWAPAPGNGISLSDGTLVMPTQGRDSSGKPFSNITYSKDGGATWHASNPALRVEGGTTECAVVQLSNGDLMLNMRANTNRNNMGNNNGRAVSVTADLGASWREHQTSFNALPEPTCMASLVTHPYPLKCKTKHPLFFSNPNSKNKRHHMTIKASLDDGNSWPKSHQLLLDVGSSRGYSCIAPIDEQHIGILYESSQAGMVFQKIAIKDIIK